MAGLSGKKAGVIILLCMIFFELKAAAQHKQTLKCKGLFSSVEVLRDRWGVNHIYASNQHDLFFAQGYCAAKDRLFQFELWRRQATGTLSEILGPRLINKDIGTRLFKFRGDMNNEMSHYHREGIAIITAYVEGVNNYIDYVVRNPEKLPVEFGLLKIKPGIWTPDVVVSRHNGLKYNVEEELNTGRAIARKGEEVVRQLLSLQPDNPIMQLDSSLQTGVLEKNIIGLYHAAQEEVVFTTEDIDEPKTAALRILNRTVNERNPEQQGMEGSNNWVISGRRTQSGATMLANDPHRKIAIPSLRYIVHLVAPGWNVTGAGEPEIPGVSIGHNESGAWGITIHQTDAEDLYVYDLNPSNLHQYRYQNKWIDFSDVTELIAVKNSDTVYTTLHYSIHGPVTLLDSVNHKAYAVKCAWLEPGAAPYLASLRLDQARSWEDFREACTWCLLPSLNMVWADKKGSIGWQVAGIIPQRRNFSGLVPVPGDGRFEWSGYLPIKERPHVKDPAKGFWATANQYISPADFNHHDAEGFAWPDAFRATRINEVLAADSNFSVDKMKKLQTDYLSVPATILVPLLTSVQFENTLAAQAKNVLQSWNFILNKNSTQAAIYDMWERQLLKQASASLVPKEIQGLVNIQLAKLTGWLQSADTIFGSDAANGRNSFLKLTFEKAVEQLQGKLGSNISEWKYGQQKYKHSQFIHPLGQLVGARLQNHLNTISLPRGGNAYTVGSTGLSDNQGTGASFRMIVDESEWDKTVMINSPGQSGDPASPYYKNLFEIWANDQYFPAYFTKKKILSVTREQVLLHP